MTAETRCLEGDRGSAFVLVIAPCHLPYIPFVYIFFSPNVLFSLMGFPAPTTRNQISLVKSGSQIGPSYHMSEKSGGLRV